MRKRIGISCIVLGFACLLIALGFVVYNKCEAKKGEETSNALLENVYTNMVEVQNNTLNETLTEEIQIPVHEKMMTVPAGDYDSIGILSIPVLELELPVLTEWSYEKLKNAPCLYFGSYYQPNFVIAAHNYPAHFGGLSRLRAGDLVMFTDVTGTVYCYEVVLLETLTATATEDMLNSGFDLSLYTCTPGGSNRVTVRCSRIRG